MRKIGVIGAAGGVGSAVAYTLLERSLADELILSDVNFNVLKSHVLDLQFSGVFHPNCNVSMGSYVEMRDSDLIIICASVSPFLTGIKSRLSYLQANALIVEDIVKNLIDVNYDGLIITASNPADVLNYMVYYKGKWKRGQVMGYSWNDTIRLHYYTSLETGAPIIDVKNALCVGEHGERQIPLFSNIRIKQCGRLNGGEKEKIRKKLEDFFTEYRALNAGRTLAWTSAQGIASMVSALDSDAATMIPCSAILDGEFGLKNLSIGVPVEVCRKGVIRVAEEVLSEEDRELLVFVAKELEPFMRKVERISTVN